ncbi:universal stress protein [Yinghuangia sp. YIM S10712]|uniref:universal stress protein n=1 Tax=Yinghuangia sp. YIM S10712 TaxID=3436930 RepID=UPI003F5312FC
MSETLANPPVVVGFEDDDAGRRAVVWAADHAARVKCPLTVVHVLDWPVTADSEAMSGSSEATWRAEARAAGQRVLDVGAALACGRQPGVEVQRRLADGPPSEALLSAATGAGALVLGSRRLSSLRQMLTTGSVAVPVSTRAPCPLVVVRHAEHSAARPRKIVVGVDGSPASERALAWAFDEASRRDATVLAVSALSVPHSPFATVAAAQAMSDAAVTLERALIRCGRAYPDVRSRPVVVAGHPARQLVDEAEDALCLVIGTHGRGGFVEMLLGSVSRELIHRAPCPLVLVPETFDA